MPCQKTERFFIRFSLAHQVDMSCLFVRLNLGICFTDMAVILSSPDWQEDKDPWISMFVSRLHSFAAFECSLEFVWSFKALKIPLLQITTFFVL